MPSIHSLPVDFVILIPCYNNQEGLIASLKSVSYPKEKFEILIVDDGSTVPIKKEELRQAIPGTVIHIVRLDKNQGVVNALNKGLSTIHARADIRYIARLDAGDICNEQRFHKQVGFLNTHPEIALLASWARFQNTSSKTGYDYITRTIHNEILKEMYYKCSFIHPSVMFRKDILEGVGFYPDRYPYAEDYAFFWKILKKYKGAVLPEKLITIAFSRKNISAVNYKKQLNSRKRIVKDFGDHPLHRLMGNALLVLRSILPVFIIHKLKSIRGGKSPKIAE